jgi:erythromycin esterase-like protein
MWRNADVLDFVGWLRAHNDAVADEARRVGFYGLDLYSLQASMQAVIEYLGIVDPRAALRARRRYACFDHFGGEPQEYGYAATLNLDVSCEDDVVRQLLDLRTAAAEYARRDGRVDPDALFAAEQNARLVVRAEQYYRAMFSSHASSWNLRDTHMAETLRALAAHLEARTGAAKLVVWAHNSHLGDASATEVAARGELNLGQLVRADRGTDACLIGFSTYTGTVTAASDWDEPAERKRVRPALPDSYEALFHETGLSRFALDLRTPSDAVEGLDTPRLQRAIGVIYRPETERLSHYYHARLPRQFDFILHYDATRAVEPLERTSLWERGEVGLRDVPETFPSAL